MAGQTYLGIPREEIPWYPTINPDLCTKCNACIDFCTNDVFASGEFSTIVKNPFNCVVGCSACEKLCDTGAISFPNEKEFVILLQKLREKYSTISNK